MNIIAEIGINHNGDLGQAKQLASIAKEAGCDYVKLQKRNIAECYTKIMLDARCDSPWGTTVRDKVIGRELSWEQITEFDSYCREIGIQWTASCFDLSSFAYLADNYDVPFHKVASGLAPSMGFLAAVARRKKLTLISTGLIEKIEAVTNVFGVWKCPFVLNHCVALYPAPPESMNMRYLWTLRQHATCEGLGYSSHENGIISTILAVFEGVEWIEHHVTLDKTLHGGDQSFSLEPKELAVMVNTVRKAELMLGDPQRKLTGVEKAPVLLPEDICEIINNI